MPKKQENREECCIECGKFFETEYPDAKYCGDICRKKAQNRTNYQNRKARAEQKQNG